MCIRDRHELIHLAKELLELMDKTADKSLPKEIADTVKLHSKLAVGSAWIPVPGADVAAGAANIWTMYGRINGKIGISLKENVIKSIAAGVATNLTSYVALSGVASTLKFIPGIGTIGGALIMSSSLYAVTLVSGWVYLKALSIMARRKSTSITSADFKAAIDEVLANKDVIKKLFKSAKTDYKADA